MDGITTSINTILKNLIKNFNTLLDCPVRFSGEYDWKKVHDFIEYIEYYKRVKCIGDEQALQELQYLLLDQAHSWWLRRKPNLNSWSEALTVLENQFSRRRPAHVVYTEILKHHYGDYESKDDFIDDKIELFNELSQPELREESKLEIIYALLPNNVQNKVKLVNISNIKELKEQLKLIKLDCINGATNEGKLITNPKTTQAVYEDLSEEQNANGSKEDGIYTDSNNQTTRVSTECIGDLERDPIIKVRRTEDLMPQDIKEEEETPMQQEEFLANDTELPSKSNVSQDDFQIDTDIMNQINNIIDESEMNISALDNNEVTSSIITQAPNDTVSIELLGFNIEATIQPEVISKKSQDHQSKSSINATKKVKIRCSYCRKCNHTSQACFKRSKHIKKSPEKYLPPSKTESNDILEPKNNEESRESLPINNNSTNAITPNISTAESATSAPPIFTSQIATTSIPYTTSLIATSVVTSSPSVILNNISEKCINPTLTTKLIAPINGKTSNKILSGKLRSIHTPSPKCHQCGTVGFYKSICPNCSPIYNNNNNHNPYSK